MSCAPCARWTTRGAPPSTEMSIHTSGLVARAHRHVRGVGDEMERDAGVADTEGAVRAERGATFDGEARIARGDERLPLRERGHGGERNGGAEASERGAAVDRDHRWSPLAGVTPQARLGSGPST